jgi:DNA replication protein DnaC
MNLIELERSLRQLRLGGMAAVLETRLRQAQAEAMAPLDLIASLVSDELTRRSDRLLERRRKQAEFRDADRGLENFDFNFNPKMNRSLIYDLATSAFIGKREDALFLGPGGTGKSHLAQAIGRAAIQQGYRVLYRETHVLLDDLAEAVADGTRREFMETLTTVPLLIIDDFGMRKLPLTAAEDLLEIIMRRRACQHAANVEPPRRRLGKTAGRCRRCDRDARSPASPRPRSQVRTPKLADENFCRASREQSVIRADTQGAAPNPAGAAPLRPAKTILRRVNAEAVLSLPLVGTEIQGTVGATNTCSHGGMRVRTDSDPERGSFGRF